jgi:hypothetical protein
MATTGNIRSTGSADPTRNADRAGKHRRHHNANPQRHPPHPVTPNGNSRRTELANVGTASSSRANLCPEYTAAWIVPGA